MPMFTWWGASPSITLQKPSWVSRPTRIFPTSTPRPMDTSNGCIAIEFNLTTYSASQIRTCRYDKVSVICNIKTKLYVNRQFKIELVNFHISISIYYISVKSTWIFCSLLQKNTMKAVKISYGDKIRKDRKYRINLKNGVE